MEAVLRLVESVDVADAARYLGAGLQLVDAGDAVVFADAGVAGAFLRRHACEPAFEAVAAPTPVPALGAA